MAQLPLLDGCDCAAHLRLKGVDVSLCIHAQCVAASGAHVDLNRWRRRRKRERKEQTARNDGGGRTKSWLKEQCTNEESDARRPCHDSAAPRE